MKTYISCSQIRKRETATEIKRLFYCALLIVEGHRPETYPPVLSCQLFHFLHPLSNRSVHSHPQFPLSPLTGL